MHEMLVTPGELEELEHEGIPMEFMVSPKEYIGADGKLTHMRFVRTEMGEPDASGRRRPVEIPGSEFDVPVDTVLLATGQFPETSWIDGDLREKLVDTDQWLRSGDASRTAVDNIFVAGDFAQGASSLIQAIGHAKNTARDVDLFLMGEVRIVDQVEVTDATETGRIREMDAVPVQKMPTTPLTHRDLKAEAAAGLLKVEYRVGQGPDEARGRLDEAVDGLEQGAHDAGGLLGSVADGSLYVGLHTADPAGGEG